MSVAWVTGAKGFIGRYLCLHLSQQGYTVLGLGHGAWPLEIAAQSGLSFWVNGEIENSNLAQILHHSGAPDIIYHLAGGSSVGLSMQFPNEDFRRTVVSTSTLLEWIRLHTPRSKLLLVSSAAVYGNSQTTPILEDSLYTPYSPYGFHKRSAELICESYSQTFGIQSAIVRLFSIYGPGLYKQLLWDLSSRISQAPKQLEINGSGEELRDWLYVEDAVHLLTTVANNISAELLVVNGGTGIGTAVQDIVKLSCTAWGYHPQVKFSGIKRPGDPQCLIANTNKINDFGFTAQYNLSQGIQKYVNWYRGLNSNTTTTINL
jgi:UDP-glucose 4-epimerase